MRSRIARARTPLFGALLSSVLGAGCLGTYQAPSPAEPHAEVRVLRVYEVAAGTVVEEKATIDGAGALASRTTIGAAIAALPALPPALPAATAEPRTAKELRADTLWVHAGLRTLKVSVAAVREDVRDLRDRRVPLMESYECGTENARRTCVRGVNDPPYGSGSGPGSTREEIRDVCADYVRFVAEAGHSYIVELTFRQDHTCSIACGEQTESAQGAPRILRCQTR